MDEQTEAKTVDENTEQTTEKQTEEVKSFDQVADEFLDNVEKGKSQEQTSDSENNQDKETKTEETTVTEPAKSEAVKKVEADESLSVEDKIAKVSEILGDDLDAIDAYVKEKGYHNDPAWKAQRKMIDGLKEQIGQTSGLNEEEKSLLENVKTITSSKSYIEATMREAGHNQEAIDTELANKGFKVDGVKQSDVDFVIEKLNLNPETLGKGQKEDIGDIAKIVRVIMEDQIAKTLPGQLQPIQDHVANADRTAKANKLVANMEATVKADGILDYKTDIEPAINKFLDENPKANQLDVQNHFTEINHSLSLARAKGAKKQEIRDVKKGNLRQAVPGQEATHQVPTKTGDFSKDADAFLDHAGYAK